MRRPWLLFSVAAVALACGSHDQPPAQPAGQEPPDAEPPVAVNPETPIAYPPTLYDRGVEGEVMLRLFVDSTGRVAPESSRVAESSGYAALDSAALAGAKALHFAPAKRRGVPVATWFLQPVEFRHPRDAALKGEP